MHQPAANLLLIVFFTISTTAWTEDFFDERKQQYLTNCSGCHGIDGKGTGPLADRLHSKPADLTNLAKKDKGIFPVNFVYQAIDGRDVATGHNLSDMPVWGCRRSPPPNSASPSSPFRLSKKKKQRSNTTRLHDYEEHLKSWM